MCIRQFLSIVVACTGGLFMNQLVADTADKTKKTLFEERIVAQIDAYAKKVFAEQHIPGVAMAIVHKDYGAYIKTYGIKELGKPEKIDAHTLFRIGSVSKGFTAELIVKLAQEGKLKLEDPVAKYIPDLRFFTEKWRKTMTIRHLLSHQTGYLQHELTAITESGASFSEIKEAFSKRAPECNVGTKFTYQNAIYALSGDVIQAVTGKSYEAALQDYFFQPLGMVSSSATEAPFLANSNKATPHDKKAPGVYNIAPLRSNYYSIAPAGGINSNAIDMAKWLHAQLGKKPSVISKKILDAVWKPQVSTPDIFNKAYFKVLNPKMNVQTADYGLGWRILQYNGKKVYFHGGNLRGFGSCIAVLPESGVGIAMMVNTGTGLHFQVLCHFIDAVLAES